MNQIRTALQSISSLDRELYKFVFVKNIYTYIPTFLKDESIYVLFIDTFEYLLNVIKEKNKEKIVDLIIMEKKKKLKLSQIHCQVYGLLKIYY